jgi:hypothetical protein
MGETYQRVNQHTDLNGMNKEAMFNICKRIETIKSGQMNKQMIAPGVNSYQKKQQQPPQLQTIYKAEDIQKERQTAFNMELKKKEEEMASIITLRKPEEIKFTDDVYDRPIGDDMERLLAETLASRERELEQLKHVTTAIMVDSNIKIPQQQQQQQHSLNKDRGKEKHVSFGQHVIEHDNDNANANTNANDNDNFVNEDGFNNNNNDDDTDIDADLSSLFNKFKKINNDKKNDRINKMDYANQYENDNANNDATSINKIIIKMSQDIVDIKSILTELSGKIIRN